MVDQTDVRDVCCVALELSQTELGSWRFRHRWRVESAPTKSKRETLGGWLDAGEKASQGGAEASRP